MSMIGKIRRIYFRQRKTVREISRPTSLSRNTVRKYLRTAQIRGGDDVRARAVPRNDRGVVEGQSKPRHGIDNCMLLSLPLQEIPPVGSH